MRQKIIIVFLAVCIIAGILSVERIEKQELNTVDLEKAETFLNSSEMTTKPVTKEDGSKFRIAYIDIDPYPASGEMLYYLIEQLKETGWIDYEGDLPFDSKDTDAKELINYLADMDLGDYIEFSREANYYLRIDGEDYCRESLKKLLNKKQVDLIICMGTWPGTFVKEMNVTDVPVMIYFSVDPIGSGLVASVEDSGQDNMWAHINYTVYNKQIRFYYDNIHFQNIGMVYYDESVAAMRAYREEAKQNGFQITEVVIDELVVSDEASIEAYYDNLKIIYNDLVKNRNIDAFLLSTDIIKDESRIEEMLSIFYENNIPVLVQNGEYYVEQGALMMVTASDAKQQAPFVVNTMANIFNGKKPRELEQEFITPPCLSLNLSLAEKCQFTIEEDLILSAEKIYTE